MPAACVQRKACCSRPPLRSEKPTTVSQSALVSQAKELSVLLLAGTSVPRSTGPPASVQRNA